MNPFHGEMNSKQSSLTFRPRSVSSASQKAAVLHSAPLRVLSPDLKPETKDAGFLAFHPHSPASKSWHRTEQDRPLQRRREHVCTAGHGPAGGRGANTAPRHTDVGALSKLCTLEGGRRKLDFLRKLNLESSDVLPSFLFSD